MEDKKGRRYILAYVLVWAGIVFSYAMVVSALFAFGYAIARNKITAIKFAGATGISFIMLLLSVFVLLLYFARKRKRGEK